MLLLDLDMAVLIRTVTGHSWANYVERTMSIFNMAMNGTSLARPSMDERNESIMARCNGLGDIRAAGAESSDFKDAVLSSVGAVINLLANRFKKCELRGIPFQQIDSPSSDDIDILQSAILRIDKTLDLEKLTKKGVEKCADWKTFLKNHVHISLYAFVFIKCHSPECCPPPRMPLELFTSIAARQFPLPIPDPLRPGHFAPFSHTYGKPVDGSHVPSIANAGKEVTGESQVCTAARARDFIHCGTCSKPRVVYSQYVIKEHTALADLKEESSFSCNAILIDINSELPCHRAFIDSATGFPTISVRPLPCSAPVEWTLFASKAINICPCSWCGVEVEEWNGMALRAKCLEEPTQQIMPRCDALPCIAAGFVKKKKRKASQTGSERAPQRAASSSSS